MALPFTILTAFYFNPEYAGMKRAKYHRFMFGGMNVNQVVASPGSSWINCKLAC